MNVQTERLDNQTARLTVQIEATQLDQAKKKAARNLSRRYNIPGFRKGKAPYKVLVNFIGEAPILEDAVKLLADDIYPKALAQSELTPYGPGNIEDFKMEEPTLVFTLPLQPEVTLPDYRSFRLDYEEPIVEDESVNEALEELRWEQALIEESQQPVAMGDRVTLDIHSEFADGEEEEDDDLDEDDFDDDDLDEDDLDEDELDEPYEPAKGDPFIHEYDTLLYLDPKAELDPIMPGFVEALLGAEAEDEVEFELTIPNEEGYEFQENVRGRKVQFHVTVKQIETVTLPEWSDELAAYLSGTAVDADDEDDEGDEGDEGDDDVEAAEDAEKGDAIATVGENDDQPTTLLELRMQTRERLEKEARHQTDITYFNKLLERIVAEADIAYPPEAIEEYIDDLMADLENGLQRQGLSLDNYKAFSGKTEEDLRSGFYTEAVRRLESSLVVGELVMAEQLDVSSEQIEERIDEVLSRFGDAAEQLRPLLDNTGTRQRIASEALYRNLVSRMVAIGRGEDPPLEAAETTPEADETTDSANDADGEADQTPLTENSAGEHQPDTSQAEAASTQSDANATANTTNDNEDTANQASGL